MSMLRHGMRYKNLKTGVSGRLILAVAFIVSQAVNPSYAETGNMDDSAEVVSPYALIEDVTAEILEKIDAHRPRIKASQTVDEEQAQLDVFFDDIEATLARVIDFNWIALNVMGSYGKTASDSQRDEFARTFKLGLVETYGRGLLNYSDQEIVVLAKGDDYTERRRITVRQEIRGADANYPLEYTMGLNKKAEWRVINVIINGINLGKTFRSQFVQAAQKNKGDLDQVIANWGAEPT